MTILGCAKQSTEVSSAPPANSNVTNPSSFPLYQPSSVVSVAPFDQKTMAQAINARAQQTGRQVTPYKGNEVLAATSAPLSELKTWVDSLRKAPPENLKVASGAKVTGENTKLLNDWGADVVTFENGSGRNVVVMVMDPQKVQAKMGLALGLIDKYQALPAMVRTPIDEKAKAQFGVSVSEMLDKSSPVGLFVGAVRDPALSGKRAIVLLDATKE